MPRNIIRTIDVHLKLPEPLMGRVYALLFSAVEGKIPQGAQAKFFILAAEKLLAQLEGVDLVGPKT